VKSHSRTVLPGPGTALLARVGSLDDAVAAGHAGATMIEVGLGGPSLIAAIRQWLPGVVICGADASADLVPDPRLALRSGASLICPGIVAAEEARRGGIGPERILVTVPMARLDRTLQAGWSTLTDVDSGAADLGVEGAEALAAACCWLGGTAVRTRHVAEVRRSLDAAQAALGTPRPGWNVRRAIARMAGALGQRKDASQRKGADQRKDRSV
jgi:hypothetical protein